MVRVYSKADLATFTSSSSSFNIPQPDSANTMEIAHPRDNGMYLYLHSRRQTTLIDLG